MMIWGSTLTRKTEGRRGWKRSIKKRKLKQGCQNRRRWKETMKDEGWLFETWDNFCTDLRLRVCFTSGSLWLGQADALISDWKRFGLPTRKRRADLEGHQCVFCTFFRVYRSWSLAIPAELKTLVGITSFPNSSLFALGGEASDHRLQKRDLPQLRCRGGHLKGLLNDVRKVYEKISNVKAPYESWVWEFLWTN